MSGPVFELPGGELEPMEPAPKQPPIGWIVLALVFAFIIVGQTAGYFKRSAKEGAKYGQIEQLFKSAVYSNEFLRRSAPPAKQGGEMTPGRRAEQEERERNRREFFTMLDDAAETLARSIDADEEAALLFAAIRKEQGVEIKSEAIATLRKSKERSFAAAAEVYGEPKPAPDRAKELAAEFKGKGFGWTMARVHALELSGDQRVRERELPIQMILVFGGYLVGLNILIAAGGVLLVSYSIYRRRGKWVPLGHPAGKLSLIEADRRALVVVGLFAIFTLSGLAVQLAVPESLNLAGVSLAVGALTLAATLFVLSKQKAQSGSLLAGLGLGLDQSGTRVAWALGGLAALQPLLVITESIALQLIRSFPPPSHPLVDELAQSKDPATWIAFVLSAVVVAPIFEEIVFRGLLLPALETALGSPLWAIVVSSLLFGAIHPTGIPAWLPLAAVGAMGAMLTYQTRSLVPAILLHMLHNAMVMAQVYAM